MSKSFIYLECMWGSRRTWDKLTVWGEASVCGFDGGVCGVGNRRAGEAPGDEGFNIVPPVSLVKTGEGGLSSSDWERLRESTVDSSTYFDKNV